MWETNQFYGDGMIDPGEGWGMGRFINPGYFSPAWYKVFAKFDKDFNVVEKKEFEGSLFQQYADIYAFLKDYQKDSKNKSLSLSSLNSAS